MADPIDRQAAIDAMMKLQAEDDEAYGCHIPEGFDGERAKEALELLPSAQPEIVRCKDCKHWTQTVGKMKGCGLGRCDFHDVNLVNCNGFCYWAERREE